MRKNPVLSWPSVSAFINELTPRQQLTAVESCNRPILKRVLDMLEKSERITFTLTHSLTLEEMIVRAGYELPESFREYRGSFSSWEDDGVEVLKTGRLLYFPGSYVTLAQAEAVADVCGLVSPKLEHLVALSIQHPEKQKEFRISANGYNSSFVIGFADGNPYLDEEDYGCCWDDPEEVRFFFLEK